MFFKKQDINSYIEEYKAKDEAVLLDVREEDEYKAGHIPGAVNVPLSTISGANLRWNKETSIYVYCLSGARSGKAVRFLQLAGFTNVKNIGGISSYKGTVEK